MAATATISRRVNPEVRSRCRLTPSLDARGGYVGRSSRSPLLSVGAVRHDFIGATLSGRSINIGLAPRIVRDGATFQIGTIPSRQSRGGLDKCSQALRRGRVSSCVQIEQIERAGEALNLDFGGLDF